MAQMFKLDVGWRLLLRDLGIEPGDVLARAGLPGDLLSREDAALTADAYFRLWEAAAEEYGPGFELRLGRSISVEAFSPPMFAALCSPDMRTASKRLSHYKKLIGPMTITVTEAPDELRLSLGCLDRPELPASLGSFELTFLVSFARMATRAPIKPRSVVMPGGGSPDFEAFFATAVDDGPAYAVAFSRADADRRFLTANAEMWSFFEPGLRQRMADLESTATVTERVHAALLEMLPSGRTNVDEVARSLGMSARSLQRKLRTEGTSFQRKLNSTREQLARHYLRSSRMPGAEISFLLGYEEPNSFFRAFQSWTGQTPEAVRASG